jgi:L-lysine 2,3-aminomutase
MSMKHMRNISETAFNQQQISQCHGNLLTISPLYAIRNPSQVSIAAPSIILSVKSRVKDRVVMCFTTSQPPIELNTRTENAHEFTFNADKPKLY